jgi:hypothetical protein
MAIFEYDLKYGPAETGKLYRRTTRGVDITRWLPFQSKPAGTIDTIPLRVGFYGEHEE